MSRIVQTGDMVRIKCPGCGQEHHLNTDPSQKQCWTWNGDLDMPTISPSINATVADRNGNVRSRCHSFVERGRIRFLPDSTHSLAGQRVDLPELR